MGMFSFIANFTHKREIAESKDEILLGQIIAIMARSGFPVIGMQSDADLQRIRFRAVNDPTLYGVIIILDRKTGGLTSKVVGNLATLTIMAEVKNYLADPDDLLDMYRTDVQNILKFPLLGDIKLNHQLNSVFATAKKLVNLDKLLEGGANRAELHELLTNTIGELREKLVKFKKPSSLEPKVG